MVIELIFISFLIIPCQQEDYSQIASIDSALPTSYNLNNGNILIITEDSIFLYEQETIIKKMTYTDSKISLPDCYKIAFLQLPDSDGGYIFCLIKEILYIFSPEVALIKSFDLTNEINADYYSMNYHKTENDKIYYTISFARSVDRNFILIYYEFDLLGKENKAIYSTIHETTNSEGGIVSTFQINISCEEMIHHSEGKVLVCFYENRIEKEISISIFKPENNFEVISSIDRIFISISNSLIFIQTAVSKNKKIAFICLINNGGSGAFCFFYKIDENIYTTLKKCSESCKPTLANIRTVFFQLANQFMFGCSDNTINFSFAIFNENTELLYESVSKSIEYCYSFSTMSVIFTKESKYSVVLDATCNSGSLIKLFSINFINEVIQSTLSPPILPQPSSILISSKLSETKYSQPFTYSKGSILSSQYNLFNHSSTSLITTQSSQISTSIFNKIISTIPTNVIHSTFISNKIISAIPTNAIHTTFISNKIISTIPINTVHSTFISNKIISSIPTNIVHTTFTSNNIHSITFSTSINSNYFISTLPSSLSFVYPSSLVSFPKCNKYLNYKRDKCIDSIPEGYYLFNEKLGIIEKCHTSCRICEKGPDEFSNNCQKCQNDSFSLENGNCINKIISCPENKPLFNVEINECVESCSYDKLLDKKCIIKIVTEKSLEIINKNIKEIILNQNMGEDVNIIIEGNLIKCQISTTENIKNNNNISKIDFNDCETKIKNKYGINYIIIQKMDILINNIAKVKYDLYSPNNTEDKIDLSIICENDKIQVYTPLQATDEYIEDYKKISEQGYNILDSNDIFYNDICSQFTSEDNTDMILLDRKKNYYNIDLTQCEEGCSFKNVDVEQKQLQCQCPIKNDFKISNNFDKKDFINSFYKVRKYSNLKVVKCYKLIFSEKGQNMNYGGYFLAFIEILFLISQIIFFANSKELVADLINKMLKSLNLDLLFHEKSNPKKKKAPLKKVKHKMKLLRKSKTLHHDNINITKIKNKNKIKKENFIEPSIISTQKFLTINKTEKGKINPKKTIINKNLYYNDEELNSLSYEEAIKIDKRGYFQYYISLIKKKQLFFFTFFSVKDYNIRIIKFSLFLFSISLYFAVNSLFFIDENIHKIHEDHGIFNFLYQLPQIIYSSLISIICNLFINSLALSENILLKVKRASNKNLLNSQSLNLYNCLRKKMYIFYIIGFLMLSFFWYFISGFCAVYKNTQIIYLKTCSISFCLSMLYPFVLNIFPGLFRIPSLKSKRKKCLYTVGNILALL